MSRHIARPLNITEQAEVSETFGILAQICDLLASAFCQCDNPEHDHHMLVGYEMMCSLRDTMTTLSMLAPHIARVALIDGTIPEDERAEFFPGSLIMDEHGIGYALQ